MCQNSENGCPTCFITGWIVHRNGSVLYATGYEQWNSAEQSHSDPVSKTISLYDKSVCWGVGVGWLKPGDPLSPLLTQLFLTVLL
jgi:hypothetical protein